MIKEGIAGTLPNGRQVATYMLENEKGMQISVSAFGGTITSLLVPGKDGNRADVVLGYRSFREWIVNPYYFNCLIGRVCNRIGGAKFSIDGQEYKVTANQGEFQLHGGHEGFHLKCWEILPLKNNSSIGLQLKYFSQDGEEGFPGNLEVAVEYHLSLENNELKFKYFARTDKPTPVNLTNHTYFNLGGEGSGTIYKHKLQILADYITETNSDSIPTGRLLPVAGTAFDFTRPNEICERISNLAIGYNDNFVLRNFNGQLRTVARLLEPVSGRLLELSTTEPGIQLYTSNWFDGSIIGRTGKPHNKQTAICLETQHFPDSVNHPEFPNVILRPGQEFESTTTLKFSTADQIID